MQFHIGPPTKQSDFDPIAADKKNSEHRVPVLRQKNLESLSKTNKVSGNL